MLFTTVLLATIIAIVYGTYCYLADKRWNLPPGPVPVPFLGSLWVLSKLSPKLPRALTEIAQHYGQIFTLYFGSIRMIGLNDAKLIHEVLVGQGKTFSSRLENRIPGYETIGQGVVLANGDLWKKFRRMGLRAMRDFGMGKEQMVVRVQEETFHMLAGLEAHANDGKPFDPEFAISNAVSNVISSLVFGKRFDNPYDPFFRNLMDLNDKIVSSTTAEGFHFLMFPVLSYFGQSKKVAECRELTEIIGKHFAQKVVESRLDFDSQNLRHFPDIFIALENTPDAIDHDSFSKIMFDMFTAGSETTATSLLWALMFLTKQPDLQDKCHRILDQVIETDRLPNLNDRPRLKYLDAVFYEVLRIVAPVPLSLYHTNLDEHAKIGEYDCPPNTLIMYNVFAVHHDKGYWGDPEIFRPERWIDENSGDLLCHSTHFMPFGIGPRTCLGESLARVEFFIYLSALLHRYQFHLATPGISFEDGHSGMIHQAPKFEISIKKR